MDELKFWKIIRLRDKTTHYGTFFRQVELHSGKLKIRLLVRTGKLSSNLKLLPSLYLTTVKHAVGEGRGLGPGGGGG